MARFLDRLRLVAGQLSVHLWAPIPDLLYRLGARGAAKWLLRSAQHLWRAPHTRAVLLSELGHIEAREGDIEGGISLLRQASQLCPELPGYDLWIGCLCERNDMPGRAAEFYRAALAKGDVLDAKFKEELTSVIALLDQHASQGTRAPRHYCPFPTSLPRFS